MSPTDVRVYASPACIVILACVCACGSSPAHPTQTPEPPPALANAAQNAEATMMKDLSDRLARVRVFQRPDIAEHLESCSADDALLAASRRLEQSTSSENEAAPEDRDVVDEFHERCRIEQLLARDSSEGWVVVQVDRVEDGTPALVVVHAGNETGERELLRAPDFPPAAAARMLQLSHAEGWRTAENIIRSASAEELGGVEYWPLVELGGGATVDGMRLYVHTVTDLDRPEYVLLAQPAGGEPVELDRREAMLGPCDEDGYSCGPNADDCDNEGLRAEERLCVLPFGITSVAEYHGRIALQGHLVAATFGGQPSAHWFARLPEATP